MLSQEWFNAHCPGMRSTMLTPEGVAYETLDKMALQKEIDRLTVIIDAAQPQTGVSTR